MSDQDPEPEFSFKRHGKGYIYFPSKKSGGKFVTKEEYQELLAYQETNFSQKGMLKIAGAACVAIILLPFTSDELGLSELSEDIYVGLIGFAVIARVFCVSFGPWRLVRGRPDTVPPRSADEQRREAQENRREMLSTLPWRLLLFIWLILAAIFISGFLNPPCSLLEWVSFLASGVGCLIWCWVAFMKFRDRSSE